MVREVQQISGFIDRLRDNATNWLTLKGIALANSPATAWRESWHPDRVQVWAKSAYDDGDSLAVRWFHGEYTRGQSIARSDLTGSTNLVGRIWHRMYPVTELVPSKKDPQVTIAKPTDSFLEIITIFPDPNIPQCQPFLQYLQQQGDFTKVWGGR